MRSAINPGASTVNLTSSVVATNDAGHGLGVGMVRRAAAMRFAPRGSGAGAPRTTGNVNAMGASSGMQTFSQTSQLARPRRVTRSPGLRPAGGATGSGSTTSPDWPYGIAGPTTM